MMTNEREFGRAFAVAMRGEPGFESPVDVEEMLGATTSIPDGDYQAMINAGIENPSAREYWEGFNDAITPVAPSYRVECNRNDGLGWVQDGCWGGEYATGMSEADARAAASHLAELYPDCEWRCVVNA